MATKDMTVLFDESGTPQIVGKYRNEWFLGCGVRYEQTAETEIFARCNEAVGLSKNRPMKNHRISIDRSRYSNSQDPDGFTTVDICIGYRYDGSRIS